MKKINASTLRMIQLITFICGIILLQMVRLGYKSGSISGTVALVVSMLIVIVGSWVQVGKAVRRGKGKGFDRSPSSCRFGNPSGRDCRSICRCE